MMPLVRHNKTNFLYQYLGNNTYKNVITGVEGVVDPELAQSIFLINMDASIMVSQYPQVERLIKDLKLKMAPSSYYEKDTDENPF